MDARQRVATILKQWLDLTLAEAETIRTNDWPSLKRVQTAKAELRLPLGQAVEQWRTENPAEAAANPFRAEVSQLLSLETKLGNILVARKHRAQEKKKLLEQALFNLRRVRSTYAAPGRAVLNSYS